MSDVLFFDDLSIGDYWDSEPRVVTDEDVLQFAHLTGDCDPLHVDPNFAKLTPFRQPIAHGLLGLALVAGLGSERPRVRTDAFVGISDWQFLKPVFFGDEVYARAEIESLDQTGRKRGSVVWRRQLINQRGEVVQEGRFETLVALSAEAVKAQRNIRSKAA